MPLHYNSLAMFVNFVIVCNEIAGRSWLKRWEFALVTITNTLMSLKTIVIPVHNDTPHACILWSSAILVPF